MNSTHQQIARRISRLKAGELVFPIDFRGLGSEDAIKMSLSRHAKEKQLERLGHGIYLKGGKNFAVPAPEIIAKAIAKKERVRIRPAGHFALYKLGMTSVEPNELIYLTDGEPRSIQLGSQRLIFKSTTAKKLALSDSTSGLLILALDELGKEKVNASIITHIVEKIKSVDQDIWSKDLQLAAGWIYNLLHKLYKEQTI
ncbi:DUF6088 family protein [Mucilaginibacter daejeonensis]|uniref:DUF6088 family protein n=1 Tax=Mucilaginibacter daejeonensis TaxID=398049 RepID=UPI001D172579|nr:DUF6088 family protein [Mucilaginibacter daejeonensis]UEG51397.1 DUF6088 family protein [Mucilaginibacter daejeonensis]